MLHGAVLAGSPQRDVCAPNRLMMGMTQHDFLVIIRIVVIVVEKSIIIVVVIINNNLILLWEEQP